MAGKSVTMPCDTSKFPLMLSKDAAKYIGMSLPTFRRRVVEAGLIGYLTDRATGRRRYRREDLDAYVKTAFEYQPPKPRIDPLGQTALSVKRRATKAAKR